MDINIAYLIAILAILVRIYVMDGYNLIPSKNEKKGQFQLNVALTVVFGLAAAIPVINAMDLSGSIVSVSLAVFLAVYGAPAVVDRVGSLFVKQTQESEDNQTDAGNTPAEEVPIAEDNEEGSA